jgi:hypothetical protein
MHPLRLRLVPSTSPDRFLSELISLCSSWWLQSAPTTADGTLRSSEGLRNYSSLDISSSLEHGKLPTLVRRKRKRCSPCFLSYSLSVGFALCGIDPKDNRLSYAMFALAGLGLGPPEGLLIAVAQLAVDPEFSGLASAHVIGLRSMGG